jgi:hypothetical protein
VRWSGRHAAFMRLHAQGWAIGLLVACGGKSAFRRPAAVAAQPAQIAPVGPVAPLPPAQRLGADVARACTAAERWWRMTSSGQDSVTVERVDTLLVPPLGDQPMPVCLVRITLPHGMRTGRPALRANDDSVPAALSSLPVAWRRLPHYDADGPDESLSGYQGAETRCTREQTWDGGDDGDTTAVAGDWYGEELTCWSAPGGEAEPDTTG